MPIYTPTRLAQSNPADLLETTIYTVAAGVSTIVKQIILANVTASAATISLSLVPSGSAAGDANRLYKDLSVPANSISTIDLSQVMGAGDFLSIKQGTASAVTTTISGVEF